MQKRINPLVKRVIGIAVTGVLIYSVSIVYQSTNGGDTTGAARHPAKLAVPVAAPVARENPDITEFHKVVQPILEEHCYDCHGDGESRAGVAFDTLKTDDQILKNPELWLKVINMTRAHIMPPTGHAPPTPEQQQALEKWIKYAAFGIDPAKLDPGRVTVHRLNSVEYKNTIRDLMGVDFNTDVAFPGDDIGYGFDNIADVLNISPLLMEKYIDAAQTIVDQAVPTVAKVPAAQEAAGADFVNADGSPATVAAIGGASIQTGAKMPYLGSAALSHVFTIKEAGDYRLVLDQNIRGDFNFSTERCTVTVTADGKQLAQHEYGWQNNMDLTDSYNVHWEPGPHTVVFTEEPVLPPPAKAPAKDTIFYVIRAQVQGPMDPAKWVHPPNYERFFTRDQAPTDPVERRAYAREILGNFATKAFRRPVTQESLDQLTDIAEKVYNVPGNNFEVGVSRAMVAILASPRFIFRVEDPALPASGTAPAFAKVDEYSLASRLSYFLWSSMPDEALLKLAAAGHLRDNLEAQVKRMLADPRSAALIQNFTDQWLQTRAMATVPLNPREIYARQGLNLNPVMTDDLRAQFKQEAEAYFGYVMHDDRSVNEFLESNYTFLNQTLAEYYGLAASHPEVTGPEIRKVALAPDGWYGGVLTMGSVLMVTSNPTRTSPVKRGKWMLENILGAPTPPPPPDIPALEVAAGKFADHQPTMREVMALHREDALCASCHDRMDPLGLSLENFNALGQVRTTDVGQPVDTTGKLATGEPFKDIRELKHILITDHKDEFYRCLTEKLMTYALGRGVEYYDIPTVDKIVEALDNQDGRFSALLMGVIDSAPFQEERTFPVFPPDAAKTAPRLTQTPSTHENPIVR